MRSARMMFRPPTDYYCEALAPLDEQLCDLIAKRKEVSGNNPGFPGIDRISTWCQRCGLNEQTLLAVFSNLYNEDRFQPLPLPEGFRRLIPIAKFVKMDNAVYAVTHMKQYTNLSVVSLEISLEIIFGYILITSFHKTTIVNVQSYEAGGAPYDEKPLRCER